MYIHTKLAMFAGLSAMGPALCVAKQDLTSSTETAGDTTTTSASTAEETGVPTTAPPTTSTTTVDEDSSTGLSADTILTVGDTTATTSGPPTPVCGDGNVEVPEKCDLSKECLDSSTDDDLKRCLERLDCFMSCTLVGEADDKKVKCDDSEMYCVPAACGDGALNAPSGVREDCDPKVMDGGTCNDTCQSSECGDSIVDKDGEDCDPPNNGSCPPSCDLEREVFLTSLSYCGNMAISDDCMNGALDDTIKGAARGDARCNALRTARPGYTFRAWLSDADKSPFDRFTAQAEGFSSTYVLINKKKEIVAKGWEDLTKGSIQVPINYTDDENNPSLSMAPVWTNTNTDGKKRGGNHCEGWTDATNFTTASRGNADFADEKWTIENEVICSKRSRLYCFEDRKHPSEP